MSDSSSEQIYPDRDSQTDPTSDGVTSTRSTESHCPVALPVDTIPWGYGQSRIYALARDPDWLYIYWEITDESIHQAVERLGCANAEFGFCLRIYDTSARQFDGTNAHGHFDKPVDRYARDAFVHIGKPRTSAHVEIGVTSSTGEFCAIARSGRAVFPPKYPSDERSVQWLTVQDNASSVGDAVDSPATLPGCPAATIPYHSRYEGELPPLSTAMGQVRSSTTKGAQVAGAGPSPHAHQPQVQRVRRTWVERLSFAWTTRVSHRFEASAAQLPWISQPWRTEWQGELRSFAWMQPLHRVVWSELRGIDVTGPWRVSMDTTYVSEQGQRVVVSSRTVHGETSEYDALDYESYLSGGAWDVVIHRLTFGPCEQRVIGRWRLFFSTPTTSESMTWQVLGQPLWDHIGVAGEALVGVGASEASLQIGASELYLLSLSSEQLLQQQASEWMLQGASERWLGNASEQLWMFGASEQLVVSSYMWASSEYAESSYALYSSYALQHAAASELWLSGASEWWSVQASEQWAQAASLVLLATSSSQFEVGASEQWTMSQASELTAIGSSELVAFSEALIAEPWPHSSEMVAQFPVPLSSSDALSSLQSSYSSSSSNHVPTWPCLLADEPVALRPAQPSNFDANRWKKSLASEASTEPLVSGDSSSKSDGSSKKEPN